MRNTRIIEEIHEAWARDNGYRLKGASCKRQAVRPKRQASSLKLRKFSESQAK